ncbi:MAG: hypothetical protein ACE366_06695 [Bradymonadia bacterium]
MSAPEPNAPDTDGEIDAFDPAALRLRSRTRWGAALIALATLLPYEIIDGQPQFPWHLMGELHPAGLVAYLAPFVAGLVILVASLKMRSVLGLALTSLTALGSAAICIRLGAHVSEWDVMPLPEVLAQRPTASVLALALVAAGSNLCFREKTRQVGKALLVGALVVAVLFYAWPDQGQTPIEAIAGAMDTMMTLPDWRMRLGSLVLATLVLWPGIVALVGLYPMNFPPKDDHPVVGLVALYGYPLLLGMFVFRTLVALPDPWAVYNGVGGVVVMVGLLVVLTSSIEVIADHGFSRPSFLKTPKVPFAIAGGVLVVVTVIQGVLAQPPEKGVDWTLKPPSPEGDALFRDALPEWSFARLRWDRRVRDHSSAQATVQLKAAARNVKEAARALSPEIGEAFTALAREARQLDLAGRRWYRLIADLNATLQRSGQPYYLDPTVRIYKSAGGLKRHFRVRSYRVQKVRRFELASDPGGAQYAALRVTRIDTSRGADTRLGFSRDLQPFALVIEDEVEDFRTALLEGLDSEPPICGTELELSSHPAMMACGDLLTTLAGPDGMAAETLSKMIVATTERHEIQHQIDGPHLPLSRAVIDHMTRYGEKTQRRVNRELSAYLAELTTSEASPKVGLVHLTRFAASPRFGAEHHVALLALEAMSGKHTTDALGDASPTGVTEAFRTLSALDDAALRVLAAEAWGELFDAELPRLVPLDPQR